MEQMSDHTKTLEEPEVNREALGIPEIGTAYQYAKGDWIGCDFIWFIRGIRFAEKYHGIRGKDE